MEFKQYVRTNIAEMHEYDPNSMYPRGFMERVSISTVDKKNGSPKKGDMIARNPQNHDDLWLVAKDYFENNFKELGS